MTLTQAFEELHRFYTRNQFRLYLAAKFSPCVFSMILIDPKGRHKTLLVFNKLVCQPDQTLITIGSHEIKPTAIGGIWTVVVINAPTNQLKNFDGIKKFVEEWFANTNPSWAPIEKIDPPADFIPSQPAPPAVASTQPKPGKKFGFKLPSFSLGRKS